MTASEARNTVYSALPWKRTDSALDASAAAVAPECSVVSSAVPHTPVPTLQNCCFSGVYPVVHSGNTAAPGWLAAVVGEFSVIFAALPGLLTLLTMTSAQVGEV